MADAQKFVDLLTSLNFGVNSGVVPLLLPKNQASFAINTTFRGGYATDRAPVVKRTLDFGGNAEVESAVLGGFFQGAGVYRPDFGSSQIIVSISGRLFTFTEAGAVWTVAEITIPGDPNSATQSQVWMWQAEKWMIISDGSGKLPIFYDGVFCRRSYGPSVVMGKVTVGVPANFPNPRVIGEVIEVTLAAPWEHPAGVGGPFNVPVRFNGAIYQAVQSPSSTPSYPAILTNIHATQGNTVPAGSEVTIQPQRVGYVSNVFLQSIPAPGYGIYRLDFNAPHGLNAGDGISMDTLGESLLGCPCHPMNTAVASVLSPTQVYTQTVCCFVVADKLVTRSGSSSPSTIVGVVADDFVIPAAGSPVTVNLTAPYSGPDGQVVWIGTEQYTISAAPIPTPTSTLYLVNLTDTSDAGGVVPAENITSIPEIPACRMGCYGLGQNWFSSVDGLSFGPSDAVGASSGTPALNYRDAVLKTTDLEVMGMFPIPNAGEIISAMTFTANLDAALGQGPLVVGISSGIFSVRAPFTLIDWLALGDPSATPIVTKSLIGSGPAGQNSTVLANSDVIFRSLDGVASYVQARRDFTDIAGNTPISREVSRAIANDRRDLLSFSSAIVFDNRLRMTCFPQVSPQGVFHRGEIVLNYDLISSLRGKAPPVWEGAWTGLNVLQYVQGLFGTDTRSFAITFNLTDARIELYELLPTGSVHFDNGDGRITWVLETPVFFNESIKPLSDLARLTDGEMYLSDINGRVDVVVKYRPLFYPCWRPWHSFSVCSNLTDYNSKEQAVSPLGFGEPDPKDCDPINNRPFRESNGFQVRLEITGHCKIWGIKTLAYSVPQPAFEKPAGTCNLSDPECPALICDVPNDFEVYSLDGIPPTPLPPVIPPAPVPTPYTNDAVYFNVECPPGTVLTFTEDLPT